MYVQHARYRCNLAALKNKVLERVCNSSYKSIRVVDFDIGCLCISI